MHSHTVDKALIRRVFNQLSGKPSKEEELIPEVGIAGSGYIWCYEIVQKQIVRISRGIKGYILDHTLDNLNRILVYTAANDVILIEENEIIYTEFD
jgi:hypothetical protein